MFLGNKVSADNDSKRAVIRCVRDYPRKSSVRSILLKDLGCKSGGFLFCGFGQRYSADSVACNPIPRQLSLYDVIPVGTIDQQQPRMRLAVGNVADQLGQVASVVNVIDDYQLLACPPNPQVPSRKFPP